MACFVLIELVAQPYVFIDPTLFKRDLADSATEDPFIDLNTLKSMEGILDPAAPFICGWSLLHLLCFFNPKGSVQLIPSQFWELSISRDITLIYH